MEIIVKRKAGRKRDKYDRVRKHIGDRYQRKYPEFDYLKYWRVIRYWATRRYNLSSAELDLLLFLRSEFCFDKEKFEEFNNLLPWNRNRLDEMIAKGWIHIWREKKGNERPLFEITGKARNALTSIYKKVSREEISELRSSSPMWHTDCKYQDKVYRNFIKKMNLAIRQEQYHAREQSKKPDQ